MNRQILANTLKKRRALLGITQTELSEISGVGLRYLREIENAKGNPSLLTLEKIFNAIGLTLELKVKNYE
jgi:transcriptional regulator with XRE-family HTH domain